MAQQDAAKRRALAINPANATVRQEVMRTPVGRRGGPRRLVVVVGRRWPASGVRLSVQFLDGPPSNLRKRILSHMNAWSKDANVRFVETGGTGEVRIARLDSPDDMAGYWSYIGTEILEIAADQPTLNLDSFTMKVTDAEFRRVVRHEAGHTLGFEHEHMRADLVKLIDRKKAIAFYDEDQGWSAEEVEQQVLTPLESKSIMGTTEADPLSIMCYHVPAAVTKTKKAITGGRDINPRDHAFAAAIYPKPADAAASSSTAGLDGASTRAHGAGVVRARATDRDADDTFQLVILSTDVPSLRDPSSDNDADAATSREEELPAFARVLASYGGARVTHFMQLRRATPKSPATRFGRIIGFHQRIQSYIDRQGGSLPSDDEMIAFGSDLFETLFQGDVRRLYDEARSRQHGRKLDLIITSMIPWVGEKPWEFAYDPSRQSFLATEDVHFVRNVLTAIPADVIKPRADPLRILVASAQPIGVVPLSIEQETEVIRRGFAPLIDAGLAEVEVLARATPASLCGRLSTGSFDVAHFIGHGVFDEEKGEGKLLFEDERGGSFELGERSVREIFCRRGLSLVFLNACQSGTGGRASFNKGLAQALVAHGLPALVANQYSVLDVSATSFAQSFYWSLAQGMSVGAAAFEARIAVNYSLQGEVIDWAVPVLYARDPSMTLCEPVETPVALPTAATVARAARRAEDSRPFRVAVWDVDDAFPSLDRTLATMHAAQKTFGFELTQTSLPLDVWYTEERAPDGSPYLWAEQLARRLASKPVELRVNALACVTRHWLCDDEEVRLLAWWPGDRKPPILIFSCAGLDDLAPEGPDTDRAVANAMVSALAGFLADTGTHATGPRTCPLWRNEHRDFKYIAGRLAFDARCRKLLREAAPSELPALEKLLSAFG